MFDRHDLQEGLSRKKWMFLHQLTRIPKKGWEIEHAGPNIFTFSRRQAQTLLNHFRACGKEWEGNTQKLSHADQQDDAKGKEREIIDKCSELDHFIKVVFLQLSHVLQSRWVVFFIAHVGGGADAESRKQATYQSVWKANVRRAVRRKLQLDEHTPVRNEHRQNEESA